MQLQIQKRFRMLALDLNDTLLCFDLSTSHRTRNTIKSMADFVTDNSNDDGVAEIIKKYFLKEGTNHE